MLQKKIQRLSLLISLTLAVSLLAACVDPAAVMRTETLAPTAPPTAPHPPTDLQKITITGVEVHPGKQISFTGRTSLPDDACLRSELTQDGAPVTWWPVDDCTPVTHGTWQISVTLGSGDHPATLEEDAQYRLRTWWPEDPAGVVAVFYFDLAPPPPAP